MNLLSHISSIISISKELEVELNLISKKAKFKKGEIIIEVDERCSNLYFIEKGIVRGYYFDEAKEITSWFAEEGDFATSFYSFISKEPSSETIQALEDCEVIQLSYSALQNLYTKFPETERIGRIITESYYIKLEERMLNIQFKTAKERYDKLVSSNPSLLQRASLGQIAAYLGITQETLIRIRADF